MSLVKFKEGVHVDLPKVPCPHPRQYLSDYIQFLQHCSNGYEKELFHSCFSSRYVCGRYIGCHRGQNNISGNFGTVPGRSFYWGGHIGGQTEVLPFHGVQEGNFMTTLSTGGAAAYIVTIEVVLVKL